MKKLIITALAIALTSCGGSTNVYIYTSSKKDSIFIDSSSTIDTITIHNNDTISLKVEEEG
jgi:uncharacterized protein YcfL